MIAAEPGFVKLEASLVNATQIILVNLRQRKHWFFRYLGPLNDTILEQELRHGSVMEELRFVLFFIGLIDFDDFV